MDKNEDKWSNECDRRHEAAAKWRKEKAGNNPFKKWFYLGKFDKKENEYAFEGWHWTPYDKLVWKHFKKYCKKLEVKGVFIKRSWFEDDDKARIRIYKSRRVFESPYRKFCSYWWKDILENIRDIPTYNHKVCTFDFYDIYENLIVNLTVKGLYFGLHGMCTKSKQQMHECWITREKLLKAYYQEDWASYNAKMSCKEVYGIAWSPEYKYTNHTIETVNVPSKEIEDYYNEQYMKGLSDTSISRDAFADLAEYINDLWD